MSGPMLGGPSPHARQPFGDRPIWCRQANGRAAWLTPRQMGLDEVTIAEIERLEAEGDATPQTTPASATVAASEPPQPARLVFGRISARDGRKLAQQAQAAEARQEALL